MNPFTEDSALAIVNDTTRPNIEEPDLVEALCEALHIPQPGDFNVPEVSEMMMTVSNVRRVYRMMNK